MVEETKYSMELEDTGGRYNSYKDRDWNETPIVRPCSKTTKKCYYDNNVIIYDVIKLSANGESCTREDIKQYVKRHYKGVIVSIGH